jgi:hypothetical protein
MNRFEKAVDQVKKYCKCNPEIVKILADAAALAKVVEAFIDAASQFCGQEPEVCFR